MIPGELAKVMPHLMGVLERGTTSPKEPSGNATLNPVEATTMPRAGMYSSCAKGTSNPAL